jgi:hypothetical protein
LPRERQHSHLSLANDFQASETKQECLVHSQCSF